MKLIVQSGERIHQFLNVPGRVFWFCLAFVGVSLVLNGSLLRVYGLHRDESRIRAQTAQLNNQIADLSRQLRQAQDPVFMERQALDRYDLADENDLVFVFADE
jgi:cell division protein FtsB